MKEKGQPKYAKTKVQLAEVLGVSRITVQRASKMEGWPRPKSDGRLVVEDCRQFIAANTTALDSGGDATDMSAAKLAETNERTRKLRAQNGQLEEEMRRKLAAEFIPILTAHVAAIYSLQNTLPAATAGVDVPQCRIIVGRVADDLARPLKEAIAKMTV